MYNDIFNSCLLLVLGTSLNFINVYVNFPTTLLLEIIPKINTGQNSIYFKTDSKPQ